MTDPSPWLRFYGEVPKSIEYPAGTLYEAIAKTAARVPNAVAWDFQGTTSTYRTFMDEVDRAARAFAALGLKARDRILISMPTSPPGVIAFYAANRLGAVPALIHPLSTAPEITHYLDASGARIAVVLDAFYATMAAATPKIPLETVILARIPDYLSPLKKLGFWLTRGRKIAKIPEDPRVRWWAGLMKADGSPTSPTPATATTAEDPAAILFSGGTTGQPKGIVLSNRNFIAESLQVVAWGGIHKGDAMLAILPLFHGFGLGVCVNAVLMAGGTSILVPVFSAEVVAKLLRTRRPTVMVGVPTLYEALCKDPSLRTADLSCLRACFSGADTLPRPVKERFEKLVSERGGKVRLLEGYGLTEAVSAIMATPLNEYREGSIGLPFPDMSAMICTTGSELPATIGDEGEICVSGPAVMLGYLDDPEATAEALRPHEDGRVWLHTGDLGRMDADGFFYFTGRLKRMIKSSGFNVYPAQVEAVLYQSPLVAEACVVGVPDEAQVERVKAYVVLRDPALATRETEAALIAWCRERLIKWSCPREVEFRGELPRTRIGKIDYRALVTEHMAKHPETKASA
ncbi:MAG TPA: AMP-binding protein [Vicinamibacteria bacterium]|nr:AMP-binding protein [Vicinamibacteria bacterium]